jgi:hypothetical protein
MIRILFLSVLTALIYSCGGATASTSGDGKLYMRTMSWAGGTLDISWYYVTSDKIVVNPVGGADPVDMAIETARNARNVASYRDLGDGRWEVTWGDGRTQTVRVETKNGDVSAFDGGLMSVAKPFGASTFEDLTYTGLASTSQVTRFVKIIFGKDGRFQMNRIGAVTGGPGTVGVGSDEQTSEGEYEIKGNTVHFRYKDGTEWYAVGQPYDLGNGEIILGDQLFKKPR